MLVLWDYMQEGIVEYEYFLGGYRSAQAPDADHAERLVCSHKWELVQGQRCSASCSPHSSQATAADGHKQC